VAVRSTWPRPRLFRTIDGTSMATPHVAGVAALYKAAHPSAAPVEVANFLKNEATEDVIQNLSDNGPDKLLFTNGL